MIRENSVLKTLRGGGRVVGTFVKLTDPASVEIMGLAGFRFVVLDTEHAPVDRQSAVNVLRGAEASGIVPLIRLRSNDPVEILQALDAGAMGILVPHVKTRADVQRAVDAAKYCPRGMRGLAPQQRSAHYGLLPLAEYLELANDNILVACYCETVDAVRNIRDIVTVKDLDVVFIGPMDLSQEMGITGKTRDPALLAATDDVLHAVIDAGKVAGTIASDTAHAEALFEKGFRFVSIGSDIGMLIAQAKALAPRKL
jgi:4-hydroxy-2-oxoheptanedioate aldolase